MLITQTQAMKAELVVWHGPDGVQYLDVMMQLRPGGMDKTRIKLPIGGNVYDVVKAAEWVNSLARIVKGE